MTQPAKRAWLSTIEDTVAPTIISRTKRNAGAFAQPVRDHFAVEPLRLRKLPSSLAQCNAGESLRERGGATMRCGGSGTAVCPEKYECSGTGFCCPTVSKWHRGLISDPNNVLVGPFQTSSAVNHKPLVPAAISLNAGGSTQQPEVARGSRIRVVKGISITLRLISAVLITALLLLVGYLSSGFPSNKVISIVSAKPQCPQGDPARESGGTNYIICSGTAATVTNCPADYYCYYDGTRYGCCPTRSKPHY